MHAFVTTTGKSESKKVTLESVEIHGEPFYQITNVDELRPFFMSMVSDSNHWMFISSNGGLTAGRKNAEYALFPYYTDDKITESADITGSKSIFQVWRGQEALVWEPFSERGEVLFETARHLYKNKLGNKILFEEINYDLGLRFEYQWNFSNAFGFVKKARLVNFSSEEQKICLLDGIQNIVPHGVGSELQSRSSNLADAYKRSELEPASGLGLFALSAIIVDKAEPSEALKTNVAFSLGLENPVRLLSSFQLKSFRRGGTLTQEIDVKGEKGAYFVGKEIVLPPHAAQAWMIVANVNQTHAAVIRLMERIKNDPNLEAHIQQDIDEGAAHLLKLIASADGLQASADPLQDSRHLSNVLFNVMRGGIFDENYAIGKEDFLTYLEKANPLVGQAGRDKLQLLSSPFSLFELQSLRTNAEDPDWIRLATEYLPLKFSRRHGDPSRPWNTFSINTRSEIDGSKILDYEGNWRDIFQNWEALAWSYPAFVEGMIFKFLNASTFDGYNPYRITKDGFDWETIEPDDPWSYIGYWGDHQLIYLLKFLEFAHQHDADLLPGLFDKPWFVYANVPYKIKPYREILRNPKDTIDFDFELNGLIEERKKNEGADGALLKNQSGEVVRVHFIEKILASVLAKLSNFIPEGGIWMNTQRPEWNDANNALVGNGVSMVTLFYLRRFIRYLRELVAASSLDNVLVSDEVAGFYDRVSKALQENEGLLKGKITDEARKRMMDLLGEAASAFREQIYAQGFSGDSRAVSLAGLASFSETALSFLEHSIQANQRADRLFHAYHVVTVEENAAHVAPLGEMLEGQVAALSSGSLSAEESLQVLDALRASALYRADQNSYLLYPNKDLPGFLKKNTISEDLLKSALPYPKLSEGAYGPVLEKDLHGNYHFNGNFKNANDLEAALDLHGAYSPAEKRALLNLFEDVFQHKAFTGRSGTFFGYEGLGSIYWHMVSKLRLAVLETCQRAIEQGTEEGITSQLLAHYFSIVEGIGVHKSPALYGAFPTDPYSHTPLGKGAQQPGMTGQVKEDILCRFGELGIAAHEGNLLFRPEMLRKREFQLAPRVVQYAGVAGDLQSLTLEAGALFFTYCQTPVIYALAEKEALELTYADGHTQRSSVLMVNEADSRKIWRRTGEIRQVKVWLSPNRLL
ncbi:MAG: hypothetical protein KIPDCIKN_03494 [Haliscomenobacter sp.]|nr:hypothetical protein [Haliscomenobacter sp.]